MLCRAPYSLGQFDSAGDKDTIYFPQAREYCEFSIKINADRVLQIGPGDSFDAEKWNRLSEEIDLTLMGGTEKIGREYSFAGHRVAGSWRGARSEIQIVAPRLARRARR